MGLGADPGMSNIFARHLADKMDSVDEIRVRDGDTAVSEEFAFPCLFSPDVLIDEVLNSPEIYKDGSLLRLPPLSGEEVYPFPDPVGPLTVYCVDHEEPETLSKFIGKGLRYADFKLALSSQTVEMLKVLKRLNFTSKEPIEVKGCKVAPKDVLLSLIPKPADLAGKVEGFSCLAVEAKGQKGGKKVKARAYTFMSHREAYEKYGVTATAYLTGTPPAIGAVMLAKGDIKTRGVIPPECLEPKPLLTAIKKKGINVKETIQQI
jgi:saccharopine dehydrogenase (NAD+, L-lysine-forming)